MSIADRMNPRERAVLVFLIVVLLAGIAVNTVRRHRDQTNLGAIRIAQAADALGRQEPDTSATDGLVDLNTATVAELDLLPGIGPALAQRIIDYRTSNGPYQSITGLLKVSGIGPAKLAAIRARAKVTRKPVRDR